MSVFCVKVFTSFPLLSESLKFLYKAYRAFHGLASAASKRLPLPHFLHLLVSAVLNLDPTLFPALNLCSALLCFPRSLPVLSFRDLRFHILLEAFLHYHHPAQAGSGLPLMCCRYPLFFHLMCKLLEGRPCLIHDCKLVSNTGLSPW